MMRLGAPEAPKPVKPLGLGHCFMGSLNRFGYWGAHVARLVSADVAVLPEDVGLGVLR